jgi:hypothetical protein
MKNFEEECFGSKVKQEYFQNYFGAENNISKSAYILVYDKVVKSKLKLKFDENNIDEFEKVVSVIKNRDFSFNENVLETDFYNILPFIPE